MSEFEHESQELSVAQIPSPSRKSCTKQHDGWYSKGRPPNKGIPQHPATIRVRPTCLDPAPRLLSYRQMNLGQFTEPKLLIPRLLSDRQEGAIMELTRRLETTGRIKNTPAFVEAVLKHEAELPTFIDGVAVPHVRGGAVQRLSMATGLSTDGISWGTGKRCVAHAVFLFAVPLTDAQTYVSVLSGLSSLIQNEPALVALMRATQPEEMLNVLRTVRMVRVGHSPASAGGTPVGRET